MGNDKDDGDDFMNTIIEIDKTYIGGKAKNIQMNKRISA